MLGYHRNQDKYNCVSTALSGLSSFTEQQGIGGWSEDCANSVKSFSILEMSHLELEYFCVTLYFVMQTSPDKSFNSEVSDPFTDEIIFFSPPKTSRQHCAK